MQAGLRAIERECETKGRALNEAYGLHAAKPADPELLGRAVAAFKAFADASGRLRDETEKALQKAVGASYSRAVTLRIRRSDNIGGETVAYRIAIDGVNRPLADYASQLPPGLLAVDARLAGASVTLQAKDLAVEALAQALAREAGGAVVRRGKTWHIVPADKAADEAF